jgi:hypothetical protein
MILVESSVDAHGKVVPIHDVSLLICLVSRYLSWFKTRIFAPKIDFKKVLRLDIPS